MQKKKLTTRQLTIAAGLAALSALVQIIHIGYLSPQWGMWIDIVAVTWIIALFLFGLRMAFIVSLIGAVIITLVAPDTWLGAGMKWLASAPIFLLLGLWTLKVKEKNPLTYYKKISHLVTPVIIGMIIRCIIILPLNYYYAIPIWTKMTPDQAIHAIPWYIIVLFNIIHSLIDVALAWILVYKFRLDRYASHTSEE
jgi:riboflavin transporter FmnP